MKCCELKYSDIRSKDVVDSKGETVGEVIDWIFDVTDNKLELKYIVLGGGRVEELLESIGAKPDIDPVVKQEDIDSISDKVYLKVDGETLKKTIDPGVLDDTDMAFSKLSDIKVIDSDNFKIGFVIDVWFDLDNMMWLLLGGGFFEELLERLKAQPDIDLLVPPHFIKTINKNEIKLSISKFQLESTCEDEYKKLQRQLEGAKPHDDARYAQLKLGSGPSRGFA
ncbi:MAG: PRC-barrel domain-containing protein [Candidatus Thorarchaeota archaeon]|jgi:sporulation protein YlmC with PRC-barrel domain